MRAGKRWVAAVAAGMGLCVLAPVVVSAPGDPHAARRADDASASPVHDVGASLPAVDSGERPGPEVLYADPPVAPQLENRDRAFVAPFDRVSGTDG